MRLAALMEHDACAAPWPMVGDAWESCVWNQSSRISHTTGLGEGNTSVMHCVALQCCSVGHCMVVLCCAVFGLHVGHLGVFFGTLCCVSGCTMVPGTHGIDTIGKTGTMC